MRPHDPAAAQRGIRLDRPPLSRRMSQRRRLHPLQVRNVVRMPQPVQIVLDHRVSPFQDRGHEAASCKSCRVGQAQFERRPTIVSCLVGDVVLAVVGRRGEAPLVPPYFAGPLHRSASKAKRKTQTRNLLFFIA